MKKTKLLSLLLAIALIFSLVVPAAAAVDLPSSGDFAGKLVIIHTNDTHGRDYEGAYTTAAVSQLKKDYAAAGAEVLLLSAGDFSQGTPLVNLSKGAAAIEFLNAAGYDAVATGNHEFDWGKDNFLATSKEAKFPILALNIIDTATNKPLFPASTTFTKGELKIGVIGIETPETATKVSPDGITGLKFLGGSELFTAAQKEVDSLKADGANLIIALGHLGEADESTGNRSTDLLEKVTGIDLFIDGHSHTVIDGGLKTGNTLRVSTGEYLNNIGVVTYDGKEFTAGLLKKTGDLLDYTGSDPDVKKLVEDKNAEVEKALSAVIGKTEVVLDGERENVRTKETNLGDFAADAILWAAKNALGEANVDAALTNGGGIRASIPAGDITKKTMNIVFPFGNVVATVEVTGAEILEALAAATFTTPDQIGAFPQVAGLSFTINTANPYESGAAYPKGSTYFAPLNPDDRISDLKIGGEPVDLEKTYVLATNNFTAIGGDTYGVFVGNTVKEIGLTLDEALINYTDTVLGGIVSAEQYGAPAGRITILKEPFSDVSSDKWYYKAVIAAYNSEIIVGSEGKYNPNQTFSRGQYLTVLYKVFINSFEDQEKLKEGAKWTDAQVYVNEVLGLGYSDAELGAAVSREEMAYIIYKLDQEFDLHFAGTTEVSAFKDAGSISADYKAAVEWVQTTGVIGGSKNADGTFSFNPKGTLDRASAAQIIYNLLNADYNVEADEPAEEAA